MSKIKDIHSKHPLLSHIILIFLTEPQSSGPCYFGSTTGLCDSTAIVPEIKNKSYSEAAYTLAANKLTIEIFRLYIRPSKAPAP